MNCAQVCAQRNSVEDATEWSDFHDMNDYSNFPCLSDVHNGRKYDRVETIPYA